ARLTGVRRVLFASSNHAIGFHPRSQKLDADSPVRPDGLYGVSKVFGEGLARLYWDKFGIESLIVRIGSCFPEPRDLRQLATWLSPDDMIRLIERMVGAPHLGCPIVYGASDNAESWWDNAKAGYLGWRPQDSAEDYREALEARLGRPQPLAGEVYFQGGSFATLGHPSDQD
ncbi:MAG: NAD-dependent epimerase/dehydratase family protein, partial [Pseudomonadota bacterium]